jgi:hypothetical protein
MFMVSIDTDSNRSCTRNKTNIDPFPPPPSQDLIDRGGYHRFFFSVPTHTHARTPLQTERYDDNDDDHDDQHSLVIQ